MVYNDKDWQEDGTPIVNKPTESVEQKYGVKGGQGHSAEEVVASADAVGLILMLCAILGIASLIIEVTK